MVNWECQTGNGRLGMVKLEMVVKKGDWEWQVRNSNQGMVVKMVDWEWEMGMADWEYEMGNGELGMVNHEW